MLSYRQIEGKSATKLTDLDFLTEIAIVAVCSGAAIFTPVNTVVTRGGRQRMDCSRGCGVEEVGAEYRAPLR